MTIARFGYSRFEVPSPREMMAPSQLTLSLDNKGFCSYHRKNPHIFQKFEELTLQTIAKKFKHYSAKGILELIRWHSGISSDGDCFKVNNNYSSFYARLFEAKYPEHKDFFRNRKSKFD